MLEDQKSEKADWSCVPEAEAIFAREREALYATWPVRDRHLLEAARALYSGEIEAAKRIVAKVRSKRPRDADALNLMSEIAQQRGHKIEAELHLARCVELAPSHPVYRYNHAVVLASLGKLDQALVETETLLRENPGNLLFRSLRARLLNRKRKYAESLPLLQQLTNDYPNSAELWLMLANTLRSLGGHTEAAIAAFRSAIAIAPWMGTVWWSLASMKTFRFTEDDVEAMERQLPLTNLPAAHRADMHYALGKAYEDLQRFEKSFQHYSRGNAIRRVEMNYDADETTAMVSRNRVVFTPEFFHVRYGVGNNTIEPIFVLGLQRAGSTLVEQILGSHSKIEGAGELHSILRIVGDDVMPRTGPDYPNGMEKLTADDVRVMGEKYMKLSSVHRVLGRPYFVDKCPFNLWHVGLIHLLFPKARIVDVRRHPLGCCYANFSMSFSHAPPLSYSLTDIGRFYADYVRLMAHFDRVLPGRIYRVIYESLVTNLESEVRRLLTFVGVPFEPGCLEYFKNDRAFNSFSNEQVRRPIFMEGLERWRNYEPWLGPLKAALGPVLDAYPGVPGFEV